VAIIALIVGTAAAIFTTQRLIASHARLTAVIRDIEQLQACREKLSSSLASLAAFEQLPAPHPQLLTQMVAMLPSEAKVELGQESEQPAIAGWVVKKQELTINVAPFSRVVEFIHAAETGRPPWRLTHCMLRSSATEPGTGSAMLVFEALDKKD